jgi:hypothetical protein
VPGAAGKTLGTVTEKGSFYVDPSLSLPVITRIKKAA